MVKARLPAGIDEIQAEMAGILYGDGSISRQKKYTYRVRIYCSINESDYAKYICHLFARAFTRTPTSKNYDYKGVIELKINSKDIFYYLNKSLMVPLSPKNLSKLPKYCRSPVLLRAFLRGIFDTDGCVIVQRYEDIRTSD